MSSAGLHTDLLVTLSVCTTTLNRSDFELLDLHIGDAILNVPFFLILQVMYLHNPASTSVIWYLSVSKWSLHPVPVRWSNCACIPHKLKKVYFYWSTTEWLECDKPLLELLCLDWALSWITCDTVLIVFCIYFILSDAVLPQASLLYHQLDSMWWINTLSARNLVSNMCCSWLEYDTHLC